MGKLSDLEFTSKTISFSNYFANIRLILVIQSYPRALGNRSRGLGGANSWLLAYPMQNSISNMIDTLL